MITICIFPDNLVLMHFLFISGDYLLSCSVDQHWAFSDLRTGHVLTRCLSDPNINQGTVMCLFMIFTQLVEADPFMRHYCKGEKHWCQYSCKMEKLFLFCCSLVVVVFAFSIKFPVCLQCIENISLAPFANKPCALWLQWSRTVIKLLSCSHQLTLGRELQLFKFHSF